MIIPNKNGAGIHCYSRIQAQVINCSLDAPAGSYNTLPLRKPRASLVKQSLFCYLVHQLYSFNLPLAHRTVASLRKHLYSGKIGFQI